MKWEWYPLRTAGYQHGCVMSKAFSQRARRDPSVNSKKKKPFSPAASGLGSALRTSTAAHRSLFNCSLASRRRLHLCGSWTQLPHSTWDPNSLTRDQTHTPRSGRWILHHWTISEVPGSLVFTHMILFTYILDAERNHESSRERETYMDRKAGSLGLKR